MSEKVKRDDFIRIRTTTDLRIRWYEFVHRNKFKSYHDALECLLDMAKKRTLY